MIINQHGYNKTVEDKQLLKKVCCLANHWCHGINLDWLTQAEVLSLDFWIFINSHFDHRVYLFHTILVMNSNYFKKQRQPIGLHNGDAEYSLWDENWICKYNLE
jgi:hypothetical protein